MIRIIAIILNKKHVTTMMRITIIVTGTLRSAFKFHACFCGLDPGNLKFETVRTNKQHICF